MDWKPFSSPPDRPMAVLLYTPQHAHEQCPYGSDYRVEIGHWVTEGPSGPEFREQGTNHSINERIAAWGGDGALPSCWAAIDEPPKPPA